MTRTPTHGWDGKIVWITGASSGIGKATALEMADRGAIVAISARRADELASVAQMRPDRIHAFPCDVTSAEDVEAALVSIEATLGPIDFAFFNAGVSRHNRVPDLDLAAIRMIVEINLLGTFNGLSPLLKRMTGRRAGHVALCGSVAGYGGLPYAAAYCASKAAIINAAVSLAIECRALGIRVQCVNPGFVDTAMTQKNDFPMPFRLQPQDAARRIVDGFESGRFEITFPRRLAWPMKLLNMLPYRAYIALLALGVRRSGIRQAASPAKD